MKSIKTLTVMAAVACCLASTSQATLVLPPGTNPTAIGGDAVLDGAAVTVGGPLVSPFAFGGSFSGILTTTVLQEGAAFNPLGGYTFLYLIANNGPDALRRFTVDGWDNAPAVVGNTVAAGIDAATADRSPNGVVIGFNWNSSGVPGPIIGGGFGEVFIRTSLQQFGIVNGSTIDGGTDTQPTYAPVPEPTTMIAGALLLLPFGASTLRILRKRQTA